MASFQIMVYRDNDTWWSSVEMERTDEVYNNIVKTIDEALKGEIACIGLNTNDGLTIIPSAVLRESVIHIVNS
jgi:hypothetical protein